MASISTDKKGFRRILFVGPDGKRKPIRLGHVSMKTARTIKAYVEDLADAAFGRHAPDPATSAWVGDLESKLHSKLAAVGLVSPRETKSEPEAVTLGSFLKQYITSRSDIKPSTRCNLEQVKRNLLEFFKADRPLNTITPGDADEFRLFLLKRLAENTARRNCGRAKQFFRAAVRKKLIHENPFADMKGCGVRENRSRMYFVTKEEAQRVLDACPDAQWRLLFALSRFGGLRCPSEHLALKWADIDWERGRITVHSPKTEHHEGKGTRQIPLFPELRPYLDEVWEEAPPGTEWVITRYRSGNANLRTQLERIIRKAGLEPWAKPFQNLRSTRETELTENYPIHVVCSWIGNTAAVAAKHYLQVTDADFDHAVKATSQVGGAQSGAQAGEDAARKQAQPTPVDPCQSPQETHKALENQGLCLVLADVGQGWQNSQAPRQGLEPWTKRLTAACSTD